MQGINGAAQFSAQLEANLHGKVGIGSYVIAEVITVYDRHKDGISVRHSSKCVGSQKMFIFN